MNARTWMLAGAGLLAGCGGLAERIGGAVDQTGQTASTLLKSVGRTAPGVVQKSVPPVERDEGLWLGKNVVKLGRPVLPPVFYEPATFDRNVGSLSELAERITLRAGIPTKVTAEAMQVSAAALHAPEHATGSAGMPSAAAASLGPVAPSHKAHGTIRISYSNGNFKGLLDMAAARFGVDWKYVDGAIQFFHTESRTFQISAIPGDSAFTATVSSGAASTGGTTGAGAAGGNSAGASGGVSANNNQNTMVASKLSVFTGIEKAIAAMLSKHGKVVASPATGTITVVDTPDTLERIAAFVDGENKALARQVVINVTVLSVTLSSADEYGINWNLVYNNLNQRYGITNSLAGAPNSVGFSAGILSTSGSNFAGSALLIKALSEQGKVRRNTTASVVTLNNQPVPVQVARQTSYLQSSQTTITAQVGSTTSLTPGTVTSGFNMSILPHVLTNGTVLLQFSTDISALRSIRTVTSNGSSIESPEMDTRNFMQRVAMKSNETLVISGFEQTDENLNRQGVGHPQNFLLGGGAQAGATKEVIVVLITPTTVAGA